MRPTWGGADAITADAEKPENRIRAWGLDRMLSGDIITEQNIHAWTWPRGSSAKPLKAEGTCGQGGTSGQRNCHVSRGDLHLPEDVIVTFTSKQYGTG